MRIDVTVFGINGNSLRWLRRLAPWSIIPIILGGLVLATVALGSVRYNGPMPQSGYGDYHHSQYGSTPPQAIMEQAGLPQKLQVKLGDSVNILPEQGWSPVTLRGTALQQVGQRYLAVQPGKAVLEAHNGQDHFKYTVTVIAPTVH